MKRRLLFSYLSITAFVLLVLEIPLGVSYANSVERRLTSDLQHDAFSLAIRSQEPLDRADAGAVRPRQELLENVWDPHWYGPTKTLDVHVASLRKKLGDPGWIETVRGVGFRLRALTE